MERVTESWWRVSRGLGSLSGPVEGTLLAGLMEFLITVGPDGFGAPMEKVIGGDVSDRAVKSNAIVVVDEAFDEGSRLVEIGGLGGA